VISVVLAVKDGLPWLETQLEALASQSCSTAFEVLICDNGSSDASAETARGWSGRFEAMRVVDASARPGPAAARNIGADLASGELIAFCDADDRVGPGWLEEMVLELRGSDVVGGFFETSSLNGASTAEPVPPVTSQLGRIPAGLAANLGVKREAFFDVGGFDENLRIGEDVELCWRLQLAGYRFSFAPGAVVAKRDRSGAGGVFRQGLAHGRSGPTLYRMHRKDGARRDVVAVAKSWVWLAIEIPRLYDKDVRSRWLRAAGVRIGRLVGSAENGVFFP
jgi:GT2 family glycosyltransferase